MPQSANDAAIKHAREGRAIFTVDTLVREKYMTEQEDALSS